MWNVLLKEAWDLYSTLLCNHARYDAHRVGHAILRARARALRRQHKAIAGWVRYTNGGQVILVPEGAEL